MDVSAFIGLVTTGAGLLHGKSRNRGASDAWQTAAEMYGLLHKPSSFWSGPKLTGSLSGNNLKVDVKNRNTASAATRFRLDIPSLNLGLKLKKKGFWNSTRPRALVGNKAFDNQVVVKSRNWAAAQEFLTPERRKVIQSFLSSFKGAVVGDDNISLTTRGLVKDSTKMLGAIDAMMRVANVVSAETPSTSVGQDEGAPAVTDRPDSPPDEPAELPERDVDAPSDSLTAQENTPGVEEFCATVFPPGALSITANQEFNESYVGKRISWTGTLISMTPYNFDFDFGAGRGIKAVLTILESESVGSPIVQAVIGLPPGTEGLDTRIGQAISFTGRLIKVDGLMKRVVIADAELCRR